MLCTTQWKRRQNCNFAVLAFVRVLRLGMGGYIPRGPVLRLHLLMQRQGTSAREEVSSYRNDEDFQHCEGDRNRHFVAMIIGVLFYFDPSSQFNSDHGHLRMGLV